MYHVSNSIKEKILILIKKKLIKIFFNFSKKFTNKLIIMIVASLIGSIEN